MATNICAASRRSGAPSIAPLTFIIGTRSCRLLACESHADIRMSQCRQDCCLRSGSVAGTVAEKWRVNTARHIIRRADYRGKQKQALSLPFDGLTMPALLFVVPCLQLENFPTPRLACEASNLPGMRPASDPELLCHATEAYRDLLENVSWQLLRC